MNHYCLRLILVRMNADPDALAGYCCSGANHFGGNGAVNNGDCPADAASAVTVDSHSCVVLKEKKGIRN